MRLTEKGQVTVPKPVRDHLGIGPGSEVDFAIDSNGVRLVKLETVSADESPGDRLVRQLREAGRKLKRNEFSGDAIMEMTRGPFDDLHPRR